MEYGSAFFDEIIYGSPIPKGGQQLPSSGKAQAVAEGLVATEQDVVAEQDREELAREEVLVQADRELGAPEITERTETNLLGLAEEYQASKPTEIAKTVAQVNRMTQAGQDLAVDLAAARKQRTANRDVLKSMIGERIDEIDFINRDGEFSLGATARTVASALQTLGDPSAGFRYVNALRDAFPNAGIPVGPHAGLAIGKVGDYLLTLPPEQAAAELPKLFDSIETLGAVIDSPIEQADLLSMLRESLADDSAYGRRATAADIFGYVDALVPLVGVGAKAARRLFTGVGHVKGSAAGLAARTTKGRDTLLDAAQSEAGDAALASAGTDAGRVVGGATLTKPPVGETGHLTNDAVPYDSLFFTPAEREAVKLDYRAIDGAKVMIHTNKSTIKDVPGGFEYEQVYGPAEGNFFKSQKAAKAHMADIDVDLQYELVKDELSGGYLAKVKGVRYYDESDKAAFGKAVGTGVARMFFGKGQWMEQEARQMTTWAAIKSATAEAQFNRWTQPYFRLGTDQRQKLNEVLVTYTDRKWLSNSELAARGINDDGIAAYRGLQRASHKAWEIENAEAARAATAAGRKFVTVGNRKMVAGAVDELPPSVVEVLHAGDNIAVAVKPNMDGRFFKLPTPQRHGESTASYQYIFVPNKGKGSKAVSRLDQSSAVLAYRPGYYGVRRYTAPYFIRKTIDVTTDGVPGTKQIVFRTARSKRSADAWIAAQEDPSLFRADAGRETRGTAGTDVLDDDMAWRGHRREDTIPDIDLELAGAKGLDAVRIGSIENAVRGMQHVAALDYGATKANQLLVAQWNRTYGKLYGNFDPQQKVIMQAEGRKLSTEADAMHDYIVRSMGLDHQSTSARIAEIRTGIADFLWNRHMGITDFLANEVVGKSQHIMRLAKSATYIVYLALNPLRQSVMQMSMMPTYMGVKGAGSYLGNGQFFRDFATLGGSHLRGDDAAHFAKLVNDGRKSEESLAALADWNKSNLSRLVDANILTLDTLADSSRHTTGRLSTLAGEALDAVKRAGIDLGIQFEKRTAFLMARNRYLLENKLPRTHRLSDDELVRVAGLTEDMSLNANRSDVLAVQRGWYGLVTQFMSHQLKMTGRVMDQAQAFLPEKKPAWMPDGVPVPVDRGGEAGFSRAERRRMAAMSLLFYGTAGYGIKEGLASIGELLGIEIPPEVLSAAESGLTGMVVGSLFQLADAEGDPTEVDTSAFSPTNFVGSTVTGVASMVHSLMTMGPAGAWDESVKLFEKLEPASFSLGESYWKVIKLGLTMGFNGHLMAGDRSEQALLLATEGLRTFPLVNNLAQGIAIMETGFTETRSGKPVVEASAAEAMLRATLGLRDRATDEIFALTGDQYDAQEIIDMDDTGRARVVAEAAKEDWKLYAEPFFKPGTDMTEMTEKLDKLFHSRMEVFGQYGYAYQQVMTNYMERVFANRSLRDQMVESWITGVADGKLPVGQNTLDDIRSGPDWQGKDEFVKVLESLTAGVDAGELDTGVNRR